jgi:hypothetical protein
VISEKRIDMEKAKIRKMRIDIRLGFTAEQLAKKYHISKNSAAKYRNRYIKVIKKQREMGLYE